MNLLVINYGAIGKRHAKNVKELGHNVVLLRHSKNNPNKDGLKEYHLLEEAIENEEINGAIVCSPTSKHYDDVKLLIKHKIPFLLEKPSTHDFKSTISLQKMLKNKNFLKYDIAYNLRNHPILKFIKNFLPNLGEIYSAYIYVGYYLPYWRKNVDYRNTISAKKELGGGVHIEMVHEIDYILWFFGMPERVIGYVNKISNLEISSEDICSAMFQYKNGLIVELHLDYLSHKYLRGCRIIAQKGTLEWDWNLGKVLYTEKGKKQEKKIFSIKKEYDLNDTYIEEVKKFLDIINGKSNGNITMLETAEVMRILEAIKISSKTKKWIDLKEIK